MSIGTSFKTIDVSAFFTALMMRDVRRGILNMRSNDFMTWRLYFMLAVLMMVFAFAHILFLIESVRPITAARRFAARRQHDRGRIAAAAAGRAAPRRPSAPDRLPAGP